MKTLIGMVLGKGHWKIPHTVRPFTRSRIELAYIQEPQPRLLDPHGVEIGGLLHCEQDEVTGETFVMALIDPETAEHVGFGQRCFAPVGIPEFNSVGGDPTMSFWLKPILSEHSRARVESSASDGPMIGRPDHLLVFADAKLVAVQIVSEPTVWGTAPAQLDSRDITEGSGLGGHSWTTTQSHKDVLERSARYLHRFSRSSVPFTPRAIAIDPLVAIRPTKPAPANLDLRPKGLTWETLNAMEKGRKTGGARRAARLRAAPVEVRAMNQVRRQKIKAGLPDPGDPLAPKRAEPTLDAIELQAQMADRGLDVVGLPATPDDEVDGWRRPARRRSASHYRQNLGRIESVGGVPVQHRR